MKKVLVTGARGQLGNCFKSLAGSFESLELLFMDSTELNICETHELENLFEIQGFDYCINCAAYTNVELAEDQRDHAFEINANAVGKLAEICDTHGCTLIHFSTDYVFDGTKDYPYVEDDQTNPINVYGASKLKGEELITASLQRYFIFRTSWLYSDNGHNFFNTVRRKAEEGADLKITTSQRGTPTNAYDLALFVLTLISNNRTQYGIYHFSNLGEATWYDFAAEIIELLEKKQEVYLESTSHFKTRAARPNYSVLDKEKVLREFGIPIKSWRDSLAGLIVLKS